MPAQNHHDPMPGHQEVVYEPVPVEEQMPVTDMPSSQQTSEMPPPPLPSSSQVLENIPSVHLLPPTPNTSQEAVNNIATTLLDVPAPSQLASQSGKS